MQIDSRELITMDSNSADVTTNPTDSRETDGSSDAKNNEEQDIHIRE